jgi:hypothetical protein
LPPDEEELIVYVYSGQTTPLAYTYPRFTPGTTSEGGYVNPTTVFVYWSAIFDYVAADGPQSGGQSGSCTMLSGLSYPTLLSGYLDASARSVTPYQFSPGAYHLCMLEPSVPEIINYFSLVEIYQLKN